MLRLKSWTVLYTHTVLPSSKAFIFALNTLESLMPSICAGCATTYGYANGYADYYDTETLAASQADCCQRCNDDPECKSFTYFSGSGPRNCGLRSKSVKEGDYTETANPATQSVDRGCGCSGKHFCFTTIMGVGHSCLDLN